MTTYPISEKNEITWIYRLMYGPACIIDGLFLTLTFSIFSPSLGLAVSRKIAKSRI